MNTIRPDTNVAADGRLADPFAVILAVAARLRLAHDLAKEAEGLEHAVRTALASDLHTTNPPSCAAAPEPCQVVEMRD